ncbi:hypothetical protein SALBM311S_11503 [Streptomyces alboniger]
MAAPTPPALVVARLVQGAFAALVIPQGFGILGATWPRYEIGKAFSLFGPVMGLSAVGGPILAGFLVDADLAGLGWRPMFLINLILGGAALLAAARLLPHDTGDPSVSVDGPGSALLAGALLGLLGGLIDGSDHGWTPRAIRPAAPRTRPVRRLLPPPAHRRVPCPPSPRRPSRPPLLCAAQRSYVATAGTGAAPLPVQTWFRRPFRRA